MKKYFFIALAMLCHTARAQDDARPTIYFNTGKIITAEKIRLRTGAFNDQYLLADGKRIQAEQVKFFQNDRGFFASTQQLSPFTLSGFAERIDQGRINLFREMPQHYDWESRYDGHQGRSESSYNLYYNKGMENLKKTTYANLLVDLSDNQQSMDFLAAYRKKRNTANLFFGVAGASLVASFVTFFSGTNKISGNAFTPPIRMKKPYLSYALTGVGVGLGFAGAINYVKSRDELVNAVDAYNR